MRADIHGGQEHSTLQSEAGYIDARPQADSSTKASCNARPHHTFGSNFPVGAEASEGPEVGAKPSLEPQSGEGKPRKHLTSDLISRGGRAFHSGDRVR